MANINLIFADDMEAGNSIMHDLGLDEEYSAIINMPYYVQHLKLKSGETLYIQAGIDREFIYEIAKLFQNMPAQTTIKLKFC
jgi:hypothetical protein